MSPINVGCSRMFANSLHSFNSSVSSTLLKRFGFHEFDDEIMIKLDLDM